MEIWPDNWLAFRVFRSMGTQWRVGMNGPVGLDYSVLPLVMQYERIPKKYHSDVFECVRVMEDAALAAIHEKLNQD